MNKNKVQEISRIYKTIRDARIEIHCVEDDVIRRFADCINELQRRTGNENLSDEFGSLIKKLKRYLFRLRAAPVPSCMDAIVPKGLNSRITDYIEVKGAFPASIQGSLDSLREAFEEVYTRDGYQPILDALLSLSETGILEERCVVLKDTDLISPTQAAIEQERRLQGIEVIGYRESRKTDGYNERLIIGNPSWYPGDMFAAPRSSLTRLFVYGWERGTDIQVGVDLDQSVRTSGPLPGVKRYGEDKSQKGFDIEDIDPITDWKGIVRRKGGREAEEQVKCRVFSFPKNYFAFIPSVGNRSVEVIDFKGDGSVVHKRKDVSEIEEGEYILLRIEGGGELVKEVANKLMGDKRKKLRRMEEEWKDRLKKEVKKRGEIEVAIDLLDMGGEKANEDNLRNWVSGRVISPGMKDDMRAIMRLLGMGDKLEEYWEGMRLIRRCHKKAGRKIREALMRKVSDFEIDKLESEGLKRISLGGKRSGELGIFRVEEVSPDEYSVSRHRARTPLRG